MLNNNLITIIKERRKSLDITQDSLADLAGVGLRTLKEFESGNGNPSLDTLEKIADALGLELTFIIKRLKPEV